MVTIRAFEAADRPRWEELWRGYLTFYETELPAAVYDETWRRLLLPNEDPHGLAAGGDDGRMLGIVHFLYHRSCWSIENKCYLQDLFVDAEARGRGAGGALIRAVYDAARAAGACEVYWTTQHFNATARRLYDEVGELTPFIKYRWK